MGNGSSIKLIVLGYVVLGMLVLALSNWVLRLRKKIRDGTSELDNSVKALENILNITFNAIIIIQEAGTIKYVNPATEKVMGSSKTAGQNIFEFKTLQGTKLEQAILMTFKGVSQELRSYRHISATTGEEKYINISLTPFTTSSTGKTDEILMIVNDVSLEVQLSNRLQQNFLTTFQSLASIIDARDYYTGQHSKNVYAYAGLLLEGLNVSEEERQDILIAAKLHDIGKVGIPDSILKKNEHLNTDEYEIMKEHSTIGSSLLSNIEQFSNCSQLIRHHHERWDGNGYPDGLRGPEIPVGAQIICIADAFDAMTSERAYRSSIT